MGSDKKKLTISDLFRMKKDKQKIVLLSVPDATTARLAERAGVDIVCLGDSLGMVTLGFSSTVPVTMDMMVHHGKAVRRGAPNTFLLACMPYQSYQTPELALRNATRFMQEVGADAVKIQGGKNVSEIITTLTKAAIPCMSHIGLIPQHIAVIGGFKTQGKTAANALEIYEDALAIEQAGAFGFEFECVPARVAELITSSVNVITYGLGAGRGCDGQILVGWDMLGLFDSFKPKFVKRYANLASTITDAIETYCKEVREESFPAIEHDYLVSDEELALFKSLLKK